MQQGIGFAYSFNTLDDRKVRLAVTQKWQGSNFSNRIWADKARLIDTLNTAIPQGVALGQNPRKVAQTIAKSMNTRYSNAERLARTEMNNICNQATKQMYEETPEITEKYKFVATLDARTSDLCSSTDNKVFDVKEAEVGINYPPMHPNCRSTTVPYFEELENSQYTRIATDYSKNGQPYYVPANLSYTEWKNSLSEEQQKYFIADKKAREQYNADKKQLAEYRKLRNYAEKNGQGELFAGMGTKLTDFQLMKYQQPEVYERIKENARIIRSEMK
jgi:SPP1 gp7 family putative phage head morphogenesis protein